MKNYKNYLFVALGFVIAAITLSFTNVGAQVQAQLESKVFVMNSKESPVNVAAPIPFEKDKAYRATWYNDKDNGDIYVHEVRGVWIRVSSLLADGSKKDERWLNTSFMLKSIPK